MRNNIMNFKKIIASILIFSIIVCSEGFYVFAESVGEMTSETTETTVANYSVEDTKPTTSLESVEESDAMIESPLDTEDEETTDTTEYEEEPEEDEESTEYEEEPEEDIESSSEAAGDETIVESVENEEDDAESNESAEDTDTTETMETTETTETTETIISEETLETSIFEPTADSFESTALTTTTEELSNESESIVEEENILSTESEVVDTIETEEVEISSDSEPSLVELDVLDRRNISTDSEFETLYNENIELVEKLRAYNITVNHSSVIKFFKELELRVDGPYLNAKMNGHWYLADDKFVETYNPYRPSNGLFGDDPPTQIITLDFGENAPHVHKSSNWNNTIYATNSKIDPNLRFIDIGVTGNAGMIINDYFTAFEMAYGGFFPRDDGTIGSGYHVMLPQFGDIWDGFVFKGWVDEEGVSLDSSQRGAFNYAFQYDGNVIYTAVWERVPDRTPANSHKFSISYFRATYSSAFKTPFVATTNVINHAFVATFSETKYHGDYIYMEPEEIYGYKISKVRISTISQFDSKYKFNDVGTNGLLTINADKNKFISFDAASDLKMDATSYTLDGCIPNHDIYIEYYYEPNENQKSVFRTYYMTEAGEELRASTAKNVAVEELIEVATLSIPRYVYLRTEVSDTPIDTTNHVFGLGYFHCASESYTTADVNANHGKFKAVMPNQDVFVYYYYELGGMDTTTYIQTEVQQTDGSYVISTETITHPVGSANVQRYTVLNKKNEGYGAPVPGFTNVTLDSWTYDHASGNNGEIRFFVDTDKTPILTLVYGIDYTSDYWTKLGFYYDTAGHGSIAPTAGSKDFDSRFVPRNHTYTLTELTRDIASVSDTNYRIVWYKNKAAGVGPAGASLSDATPITLDEASFNLFAAFEEDPDCFVDIKFINGDNCYITGTNTFHLVKNTPVSSIILPAVHTDTGYTANGWIDENGNQLDTTALGVFNESHTYRPHVTANFTGSTDPVKPIAYLTYNPYGVGTAHIYGVYGDRKYVLTDRNGKVLIVKDATSALGDGFDNLAQGTTYKLYEVLSTVNPVVGSNIPTGAAVSSPYVFGVKALYNIEPAVVNNANGTNNISFTTEDGVEYALLDDRYAIVQNWSTTANWTNLQKGTYYLVVARRVGDNVDADDDNAIRNGKVVYTRKNDLSSHNYRLIIIGGDDAFAQGAGSVTATTFAGMQAKLYQVAAGTAIQVRTSAQANYKTIVLTSNVNLNAGATSHSFTMPNQDVVIYDAEIPDVAQDSGGNDVANTLEVYNNKADAMLIKLPNIKTELNSQAEIANAIQNTCIVKHYLVMNKYATKKTVVQGLGANNGKVAPYEYSFDVQSVVLGLPYPNSISTNTTGVIALENGMIGNDDFALNSGSITWPYTGDETEMGSAEFDFGISIDNGRSLNYIKKHKVNVSCATAGIEYDENFYIADGASLTSSADYATSLAPKLQDIFDNTTPASERKEYIYQNITENSTAFDVSSAHIYSAKALVLNYLLNNDRETKKTELSTEIVSAQTKYDTLTNEEVKNTLQAAINVALNVRNEQATNPYTVDELNQAILTLRAAKDAAVDPAASDGEHFTITLNGNGGNLSETSITVTVGNAYTYDVLASVTGDRSGYTLSSWNTEANGSGTVISASSIVGLDVPGTLYAIWRQNGGGGEYVPSGGGVYGVGGGGGGGGGGRGGFTKETILTDKQFFTPLPSDGINYGNNSGVAVPIVGQTIWIEENTEKGKYIEFDQFTNTMHHKIGDKMTFEPITNQWVVVQDKVKQTVSTYRTDPSGNIIVGKFATEDGKVYYLSETQGDDYGKLMLGWIIDPHTNYVYYSNPQTGTLVTGWYTIDGYDYYFTKPQARVTNLQTLADTQNKQIYGMMLTNVENIDGYSIDEFGRRKELKPYLFSSSQLN